MTVKEVLALLSYSTRWKLVGAYSGKILCRNTSSSKQKDKYAECDVTDKPIVADIYASRDYCGFTDYIAPMVSIWVSGK